MDETFEQHGHRWWGLRVTLYVMLTRAYRKLQGEWRDEA